MIKPYTGKIGITQAPIITGKPEKMQELYCKSHPLQNKDFNVLFYKLIPGGKI